MTRPAAPLRLCPLPGNGPLAARLAAALATDAAPAAVAPVTVRRFPDGESYVRLDADVRGADVALVCTLDRPDDKLLPLLFLADAAADLGARSVGLVAPYLAYLRQDRRFLPGEDVTSRVVARLLSGAVGWLATVDPHLHRVRDLGALYAIPHRVLHAGPLIAAWIGAHVDAPLLVGPDEESAQWVAAVSAACGGAPWLVMRKARRGDRDVAVTLPDALPPDRARTPVLVDDIVSTGHTLAEAARLLVAAGYPPPLVVGVHAVFAPGAAEALARAGVARVVTVDTIPHPTNGITVDALLADAVRALRGA